MTHHKELTILRDSTWVTSGARFNAESRLRKRHSSQLWSIAFLSATSIIINITPYFFESIKYSLKWNSLCGFISTSISIAILSLSFYTASSNYSSIADSFHNCAKLLRALNKKIVHICEKQTDYDFNELEAKYQQALDDCQYNHSRADYDLFYSEKQNDTEISKLHPLNKKDIFFIHTRYHFSCYGPYYITALFLFIIVAISIILTLNSTPAP